MNFSRGKFDQNTQTIGDGSDLYNVTPYSCKITQYFTYRSSQGDRDSD